MSYRLPNSRKSHFATEPEFPPVAGSRSFFDVHAREGPVLHISESLQPWEIVKASWAIVGPGSRDLWAAYARALSRQDVEQFFAERQIGAAVG